MVPAADRIVASGFGLGRRGAPRLAIVLVVLAFAAASAGSIAAADPPPGVTFDGQATVTVVHGDGPEAGLPLAGATVTLVAAITDFPDEAPIQVLTATTFADGVAAFDGVARGGPNGPTVHLAAMAQLETATVDDAGCTVTTSWEAIVIDVPAAQTVSIPIAATPTSRTECPTPPAATNSPAAPSGSATPSSPIPTSGSPAPAASPSAPTGAVSPAAPSRPRTERPDRTLPRTDTLPDSGRTVRREASPLALIVAGLLGTAIVGLRAVRRGGPRQALQATRRSRPPTPPRS